PGTPQLFCSDDFVLHDWMHLSGEVAPLLVRNGIRADCLYFPTATDFITAILREIEAEFFGESAEGERLIALKLEELFLKLGRAVTGSASAVDKETREKLRVLRGHVFAATEHRWTVGEMAERVHLSSSRFQVVYKSLFGISPMRDLIDARIDRAKKLLLSSDVSVFEVARAVGYDNVCHFIRQFKEAVGVSPRAYRKPASGGGRK
ncbi:MAG: helix-turn-helix transcriptional regulator, partial [Clostridia bacterium]|nr:helix-turn-helix transcriptional regulator [Clostridia bacterium]